MPPLPHVPAVAATYKTYPHTQFWLEIDHQLSTVISTAPQRFADLRAILHNPGTHPAITEYTHRYYDREPHDNAAFFAGGGGDSTLLDALLCAGWHVRKIYETYHYVIASPDNHDIVLYTEGDLELINDRITAAAARRAAIGKNEESEK